MLALMHQLSPQQHDVHLALVLPEGGLMAELPDYVTVHVIQGLNANADLMKHPLRSILRRLGRGQIRPLLSYFHSKLSRSYAPLVRLMLNSRPDPILTEHWDVVIDYPGPPGEYISLLVANHMKARRRLSWVHFDLSRVHFSTAAARRIYARMDRIYAVSEQAAANLISLVPEVEPKVKVFHNLVDPEAIRRMAREDCAMELLADGLNIVTVGRIGREKGQLQAMHALRELQRQGVKARWHIVGGDDGDRAYLASVHRAAEGLDVRFYGPQANPYAFMARADVYVQPSVHEGYCIALAEARALGLPIVATDFTGAREQLSSVANARIISEYAKLPDAIHAAVSMGPIAPDVKNDSAELSDFLNYIQA